MVSGGSDQNSIEVVVDGGPEMLEFDEDDSLMRALRRKGHYSVKNGCSEGICGSCNVMYGENQIVRSCLVPAERYDGEELTTAEGLIDDDGTLHPLQQEFLNHAAAQCGFCIPGMILSGVQLLEKNPDPSETEIRSSLRGNICRCTGYIQQFEAVKVTAERMKSSEDHAAEADD